MTFPHTKMSLGDRLSEALGGQERGFLAYLAQEPSEILEGQGELKEKPEEVTEGHWVPAKKGNPGSFLIKPSDRDKFINWGKKKAQKRITEGIVTLKRELDYLRPQLAAAAQEVYDQWDQSNEDDDEFCGGGICDAVATALSSVIANSVDAHIDDGGHEGDDHAFLIVSRAGERYWVDIPPRVYESGGGYSWTKIPDVRIEPDDIVIEPI